MDPNESAYPCPVGHIECKHPTGLTKREWFAGEALKGLLANTGEREDLSLVQIIDKAVVAADMLIEKLNKNP